VGRVTNEWCGWREATERALYGPGDGFYTRPGGPGPAGHFRTSVHASPLYAGAVATLLCRVDTALGRPDELALVDVGAGRGELLTGVLPAPGAVTGLLFANEWLDNVPVEVVETDEDGVPRRVLVRADGTERLGEP